MRFVNPNEGQETDQEGPLRLERSAVVLAGGRSSRFGASKALQPLAGKPLIRHIVERLSSVVGEVVVVIGQGELAAEYCSVLPDSIRVINDELEGKTPLVGIVTGFRSVRSNLVAVLACDIPFVNDAVIELLFRRAPNANAVIPRWNGGRIEPLEAVYRRLPALNAGEEALAEGGLSQKEMIRKLAHVVYVSVEGEIAGVHPGLRTFFNVNTREDLAIAEKLIAEKSITPRGDA